MTPDEAWAWFDGLPAVAVDEMLGSWSGAEVTTGHPLGGLLASSGWVGKRFDGPDAAHPLVFADRHGEFCVDPAGLPLGWVERAAGLLGTRPGIGLGRQLLRWRSTRRPRARLRMVEHRGLSTATMIYDAVAIHDHFRRVDADTLLGVMDARALTPGFFFVLRRRTH